MLNILIVGHHPVTCLGMGMFVKKVVRDPVLYVSHSYTEGLGELSKRKPDLIILDLTGCENKGQEIIGQFRKIRRDLPILVLSDGDELLWPLDQIQYGSDGILHKIANDSETERVIQTVNNNKKNQNKKVILPKLADRKTAPYHLFDLLSSREKLVLGQLMTGKMMKQIAKDLNVKISTVSTQKAKIFQKLEVNNMVDLIRTVWRYENSSEG